MVACAAVATHPPPISLAVPMTSCALTDRGQHFSAVESISGKTEVACDVLSELEKSSITKEILESTRIGATVNEVRKKTAEQFPVVSKRCRALIKAWQKLVEVRSVSSATSSANGTPNLVSPSLAKLSRRVTPCTPVNRRVSSTGLAGSAGSSATVSPANGSYAPKQQTSPSNGVVLHKTQSVGTDLVSRGEDPRNGKRKLDDGNSNAVSTSSGLRRTKTAIGSLSTKDLVAELSQNLPEHMSIDSSIREHEERVKREQQDEEYAMQLYGGATTSGPYTQPERKKRKYERKLKSQESSVDPSPASSGSCRLIIRLPRVTPVKEEPDGEVEQNSYPVSQTTSRPESSVAGDSVNQKSGKTDWLAMLPSLEELKAKAKEIKAADEIRKQTQHHPTKAYIVRVRDRDVLALPYLDVPIVPDFIQYRYPNATQYYAEENFIYGAPRDA
ncbi:hypothetical protein KIN20_010120 [Parelaphostrongylus tenuis]|uniref:Mediator of RNA polymerase II transcription subunit 26 n=1 Tax=Parelaphostrongylus tenuis TaxID=148309 RepID=A0AAD5MQ39_PARTN|nr:hypothetical protein KIN20_010120 [Parelaphostrongylus tenuis]